jgi:hypothetical protein
MLLVQRFGVQVAAPLETFSRRNSGCSSGISDGNTDAHPVSPTDRAKTNAVRRIAPRYEFGRPLASEAAEGKLLAAEYSGVDVAIAPSA